MYRNNSKSKSFKSWGKWKRLFMVIAIVIFLTSTLIYMTPPGSRFRTILAETAITTQSFRNLSWVFVGGTERDRMLKELFEVNDKNAAEEQELPKEPFKEKVVTELTKVETISGKGWVGKKIYIYDPKAIRVVVPQKKGTGEMVSSMVKRTGAVAGINAGGFVDPGGFGNGFAPIGLVMSGGEVMYNDSKDTTPQHVVAISKEGALIIGKHSLNELRKMNVSEAVSFYPRVIVNGKPLITKGDGGRGIQPRTAVGQREDGTVIFVVIDGRQTHSLGATLRDVQDLLLEEGCINAGFLDGGSSSVLVGKGGEVLTKPSSPNGKERALPTAFLVFDNPDEIKVNNIWKGLDTIDPGGTWDPDKAWKPGGSTSKSTPTPTPTPKSSNGVTSTTKPNGTAKPQSTKKPQSSPSESDQEKGVSGDSSRDKKQPSSSIKPTPKPPVKSNDDSTEPSESDGGIG